MFRFFVKRFCDSLMVLLCLLTITFFMIRFVPGGPFDQECNLSETTLQNLSKFYGYDQPIYKQYFTYVKHLICGDFGPSLRYPGYTVNQLLKERIPVSFELGLWAILVALIFGGICGILASIYHNRWLDKLLMSGCLFGISLPTFVLGPIIILIFALNLGWCQAIGWNSWDDRILPTLTLSCMYAGYIARLIRTSCLDVLSKPFIRTAFAKGLGPVRIFICHVIKNALGPVLTYLGPTTAAIMSGSLVIESLFQIPGAGSLFISAVDQRDTALLLGTVFYFSVLILLLNFLVDIVLSFCNPKQHLQC